MTSSIFGIGSASNSVTLLSFRKTMQNRTEPSFSGTRTTGDEYGETDFSITHSYSISLISESMTSRALNRTGYPFDRIGSDVNNLISC